MTEDSGYGKAGHVAMKGVVENAISDDATEIFARLRAAGIL